MSTTVTLNIPAISCGHCVATIQRETKEVPGVLAVEATRKPRPPPSPWQTRPC